MNKKHMIILGSLLVLYSGLGVSYSSWNQESIIRANIKMNSKVIKLGSIEQDTYSRMDGVTVNLYCIPVNKENEQIEEQFDVPVECDTCEVYSGETHLLDISLEDIKIEEGDMQQLIKVNLPVREIGELLGQEGSTELTLKLNFKQILEEGEEGGWEYPLEADINVHLPEQNRIANEIIMPSVEESLEQDEEITDDVSNSNGQSGSLNEIEVAVEEKTEGLETDSLISEIQQETEVSEEETSKQDSETEEPESSAQAEEDQVTE